VVIDTESRSPARGPSTDRSVAFKMAQAQRTQILDRQKGLTLIEGYNETNRTRVYHKMQGTIESVRVDQKRPFRNLKKTYTTNPNARKDGKPTSAGVTKGRKAAFPMEKTQAMSSRMSMQQHKAFFEKIPTLFPKRDQEVAL
jgi:hypothetical protein